MRLGSVRRIVAGHLRVFGAFGGEVGPHHGEGDEEAKHEDGPEGEGDAVGVHSQEADHGDVGVADFGLGGDEDVDHGGDGGGGEDCEEGEENNCTDALGGGAVADDAFGVEGGADDAEDDHGGEGGGGEGDAEVGEGSHGVRINRTIRVGAGK
jgi:hypothetical protein